MPLERADRVTTVGLARGLIAGLAATALTAGCGGPSITEQPNASRMASLPTGAVLLDDFESGNLGDWRAVDSGAGNWFVYEDGSFSPDPAHAAIMAEHRLPDPPQGNFAASTDTDGPGTHVLFRDLRPEGDVTLHLTAFHVSANPFDNPATFAHDRPEPNQQFRIDLINPLAPIDSLADADVLATLLATEPGDPTTLEPQELSLDLLPWSGHSVRLRIAKVDNQGPMRVGVDNIWFEPTDPSGIAGVELLETPQATTAVDLILQRMTEAEALAALIGTAEERAASDSFAGAVLVARDGDVLLEQAWGLADRGVGRENSPDTQFRLGSMNKMFTAVATLQLVDAGRLDLDEPVGRYLPDYPNDAVASGVTIRHLLAHTGGTGDIFGPQFDTRRLELREHSDYIKLYGSRAPTFEPGSRWEYSNYGYVLLGAIIEAVSGTSYYDYVREHIYQALTMDATNSLPESEAVPGRATGYMRRGSEWVPNTDTLPWRGTAAGGGYSTVGDLLRFAEGLRSGALISDELLTEATQPQSVEPYGFGFELRGEGSMRSFGHGGGAPGMNGDLRIFPALGYVVVGLSNLDPPAATDLVEYFVVRMPDE